jgi:hypothetical protein
MHDKMVAHVGLVRAGTRTLPPNGGFENFALIWPRFNSFDKAGSHGIISNVLPPGLGALVRPNSMMEAVFLPAARRVPKCGGESTFPIFDPRIEKAGFRTRPREKVEVIGHQNIWSDVPFVRLRPDLSQQSVDTIISQPTSSAPGANG